MMMLLLVVVMVMVALQAIEERIEKKLEEFQVRNQEIMELFRTVNPARRMARLNLDQYRLKERSHVHHKKKRRRTKE